MEALTPASADDLPLLGEVIADDPFWQYPAGTPGREGVAHLRVWTTTTVPPGHLAVVTETGSAATITESAQPGCWRARGDCGGMELLADPAGVGGYCGRASVAVNADRYVEWGSERLAGGR